MKFVPLYKGIKLTVQRKYTKYTRVYKTAIFEKFQLILNHSFIFLVTQRLYYGYII